SGKDEGEHGAHKQAHQHGGVGEGQVNGQAIGLQVHGHDVHIGYQQSQSGEGGGANGKALAGGGGGVAQRVESVGAVAHFLAQAGHFGDAAGVVRHGAVGVGGQGDAQGGEHTHSGDADA